MSTRGPRRRPPGGRGTPPPAGWLAPLLAIAVLVGCTAGPDVAAGDGGLVRVDEPATAAPGPATGSPSAGPTPTAADPRAPAPTDAADVLARTRAAAASAEGEITVVVLDASGRALVTGPSAERSTYTASLVKMLVVAEALARSDAGQLTLGDGDMARMRSALTSSDDAAMSALWVRHGGPGLVRGAADRLGLTGTAPPAEPGQWGESLMSAADVATFLSRMSEGYGPRIAAVVTRWLSETTPDAADGFDQLYGLLAPANETAGAVAAKQGWMCCVDARRHLHSAGVLPDGRTVVLLGDFPATTSWSAAVDALDSSAAVVSAAAA